MRSDVRKRRLGKKRIEAIVECARDDIFDLTVLADAEKPGTALALYRTASLAIGFLTFLCQKKPELFEPIARENFSWPVLYALDSESMEQNAALARSLGLASNTGINMSPGSFSRVKPANIVAAALHQMAQALKRAPFDDMDVRERARFYPVGWKGSRHYHVKEQWIALEAWGQGAGNNLPKLSRATASQWAQASADLFLIVYGPEFDTHPDLRKLRSSVARAKDGSGKIGTRSTVRQRMRQAIKQAWKSIAVLD